MTYSIVAFDEATGQLGAAVQSHWFAVGPVVPWVRPGVGAVCTQSIAEPAYGPRLLDAIAGGGSPQSALDALLTEDPLRELRQVAVVDASGATGIHTGDDCIAFAGHETGPGFSVQANMMVSEAVWPALAAAFLARRQEPLAERLLSALQAAEAAGGDVRGRQSAALVVAPATGEPWRTDVDLRVDDHAEPVDELARLLRLHRAYELASQGDALAAEGRHDEAHAAYECALALAPESDELLFWAGLAAAHAGEVAQGVARVGAAIEHHAGWVDLLARLGSEIAPGAQAIRAATAE